MTVELNASGTDRERRDEIAARWNPQRDTIDTNFASIVGYAADDIAFLLARLSAVEAERDGLRQDNVRLRRHLAVLNDSINAPTPFSCRCPTSQGCPEHSPERYDATKSAEAERDAALAKAAALDEAIRAVLPWMAACANDGANHFQPAFQGAVALFDRALSGPAVEGDKTP